MKHLFPLFLFASLLVVAETAIPITDCGFEDIPSGWNAGEKMNTITAEAAKSGKLGLRVWDQSGTAGSSCSSRHVPVVEGKTYKLSFQARAYKGLGQVGVYMQFMDAKKGMLNTSSRRNEKIIVVPSDAKDWKRLTAFAQAPKSATALRIWIHSFNSSSGGADFDDFELAELTDEEAKKIPKEKKMSKRNHYPSPTKKRIAEIAAMLPESPRGMGVPCTERAVWDKLAAAETETAEKCIRDAERYLDTAPPEVPDELYLEFSQTGNRTNYQRPYGQRSGRISAMLLAECLEGKGRFLKTLEQDVLAMCDERSWTMPAHDGGLTNFKGTLLTIDLGSSARGFLLAKTDWWLGSKLSPEVRERIRSEVKRRILDVYSACLDAQDIRGNWWMKTTNNWNAVCTANVIAIALSQVESREGRARYLAAAERSNPYFISGFTNDGYCSEGMGYWNYGFGHYMILGLTVRAATDGQLDFFKDEKLRRIAAYARAYQIQPGRSPAFADGGGNPGSIIWALIRQVYPEAVPSGVKMPNVLSSGHVYVGLRAFGQEPPANDGEKESLPIRDWFPDAQVLLSRTTLEADVPFGTAIKGGHNAEHHNHNDVGTFTIMLDGIPFVLDPGGEVYTRRTFSSQRYVSKMLNSYGHPVPLVNGKLQKGGRSAAAKVLKAEFSDSLDHLELDLSAAYAVPELTKLVRTFVNDREARTVTITDTVEFSKPCAFGTALPTYSKFFRRDEDTIVFYTTAKKGLLLDVAITGGAWQLDEEEIENPNKKSPTRLGFNFSEPVTSARVKFVFRPNTVTDDLPGLYQETKWETAEPELDKAIIVEAENFSAETNGSVTICEKPGATGKAFKFWNDKGHALEYSFTVPSDGSYAVMLRFCGNHSELISRQAFMDGKALADGASYLFPDTEGWSSKQSDWADAYLNQKGVPTILELSAGKHVLRLVNDCGVGLNLDQVKLVPVVKKK